MTSSSQDPSAREGHIRTFWGLGRSPIFGVIVCPPALSFMSFLNKQEHLPVRIKGRSMHILEPGQAALLAA